MPNRLTTLLCAGAAFITALTVVNAQTSSPSPAPSSSPVDSTPKAPLAETKTKPATPPLPTGPSTKGDNLLLVQASTSNAATSPAPKTSTTTSTTTTTATTPPGPIEPDSVTDNGGVGVREFQGDDVGAVLRLLARQAKINMVVSEAVTGTVTMRLEDVTALQAVTIIVKAKGLFLDKIDNVFYIKTVAERTAEPTESDSYQFSYARAKDVAVLIAPQMSSKEATQVDERTNTLFFRETRANIDNVRKVLAQIDKPTKQVMIEARLVEITANPKQAFGINWSGVVGGPTNPQSITYGAPLPSSSPIAGQNPPTSGFALGNSLSHSLFSNLHQLVGQFAILSVPQMSVTLQMLNDDADAEFLANPRVVTADNMQAKIEIIRSQPVPQLNFNEQTATAVFGGFQDKKFGNTLVVKPSVNKDNFITLSVKPEISNKVGDQLFSIPGGSGGTVASPIIDTRSLDSNVLIKSGDTLAIGGLLQDEVLKQRTKVPMLGDIPGLGYMFQSRSNVRTKRNLLVFVTPTIIDQHYGTGLEDQVSGLHHSGEEYADPNGWRNNAKGSIRIVPTSHRPTVADYPKPGMPPPPARTESETTTTTTKSVDFKTSANERGL
jgi:type IV pilus secretin PilQ/predicted competence protein